MNHNDLLGLSRAHMQKFCSELPGRSVGSAGNQEAAEYFKEVMLAMDWEVEEDIFKALDWSDEGATLQAQDDTFEVFVSPYAPGCLCQAELAAASTLEELEAQYLKGKIVLLYGAIAAEQLMPKNFVFYNPPEHRAIVSALENSGALALLCATGRNAALAGGVYPFPLIEDGDFILPSVYMTDQEGQRLLSHTGQKVHLESRSKRIPSQGSNIVANCGSNSSARIIVTAHIDAKKGTPGALDNATGVTVILLLAALLEGYSGNKTLELVALNGEDYYAAPGQMLYLERNRGRFDTIAFNINIDGAGFYRGLTAVSFYDLPEEFLRKARETIETFTGITEGAQWFQGDHGIFIQQGLPAIAVSSAWFIENIESQTITHTPADNLEIIDHGRLVEIASALNTFIRSMG